MAEVSRKLQSGVYRLSALRKGCSRSMCTGESHGSLLVNCIFIDSRVKEESARDKREVQSVSKSRTTKRKSAKLSRVRKIKSHQEDGTLLCATSLELDSSRFIGFVDGMQTHKTALYLTERLQPVLQEKLLPCRMRSWTRGGVFFPSDTIRSPQQLRAFCTVILILAEQGSERLGCGQRLRSLHSDPSTTSRNYSWRSDKSSTDAPLLYRSRTAYYDILKVSPGATQSQIKTAYYKQSFIYHPDKNPGSKEAIQRFSEISEAYTILSNISLRRKYDRGILNQSEVQSAGRPSSREATSRPTGSPQQQQHQQQRARQFSQGGGKPMFDFDAFYQAHYGEQLQRERDMRTRKERMQEKKKQTLGKWMEGKTIEMTVVMMLAMAGLIFINICRS